MTDLAAHQDHSAQTNGAGELRRLADVPVELSVEIGRARMTVGETLELRPGSIVILNKLADEPVDLLVNGTTIAHGEVVVVDEDFALRITEVLNEESVDDQYPTSISTSHFDEQELTAAVAGDDAEQLDVPDTELPPQEPPAAD